MFSPEASMNARSIGGAAAAAAIVAVSFTTVTAQRGQGAAPPDPSTSLGAGTETPRMADGHPDLNGWWGGGGGGFAGGRTLADLTDEKGNVFLQLNARSQGSALGTRVRSAASNFERDSGVGQRADPNKANLQAGAVGEGAEPRRQRQRRGSDVPLRSRGRAAHGLPQQNRDESDGGRVPLRQREHVPLDSDQQGAQPRSRSDVQG
jgi:hypothetical protein